MLCVALLFGKETLVAGDEGAEVARASQVGTLIIDFVENAMAERKPDATHRRQGGPDSRFGAGGPARLDAWPAGRVASRSIGPRVNHWCASPGEAAPALPRARSIWHSRKSTDLEKAAGKLFQI